MKATRRTIPDLAGSLSEFENSSGTLRGIKNPQAIPVGKLDETERNKLRVDSDVAGIHYVIVSYHTPILWVTKTGWVHRVRQSFSQTTSKHMGLLYKVPEGYDPSLLTD